MKNFLIAGCFIVFLLVFSTFLVQPALAEGWLTQDGTARITSINIEGGVIRIYYKADNIANPDSCENDDIVVLHDDSKTGDRQYRALLAAQMSNKPIKLYGSGCFSGWGETYPRVGAVFIDTGSDTGQAVTFVVCANYYPYGGSHKNGYCSCGGGNLLSKAKGPCYVTSDAGSCSAGSITDQYGTAYQGECCVCSQN